MAGDWIKMRTDLYRDPKVCVMADALLAADGDLARHVDQHCQRAMAVTRNVTRNATVGALVSVWGVMRLRGKRQDDDLVCRGVKACVLDDIADLPGFGDAMLGVGWAIETPEGLVFPNFFGDYNADPTAGAASSSAERQRRYRERQKERAGAKSDAARNVTRDVTVTHREEKRREEKEEQGALRAPSAPADAVAALDPVAKSEARGTKLPEGWEPSEAMTAWARNERPDLILSDTLARFRDYWRAQPGAKGRKADWPATWRNWVRNEKRQPGDFRGAAAERAPVTHDAIATQRRLVAESEARARKEWEAKQAAGGAP